MKTASTTTHNSTTAGAANAYPVNFEFGEEFAHSVDEADPLRTWRNQFELPGRNSIPELIYFASHSLGCQPKAVRRVLAEELDRWGELAVEGHFQGEPPWYTYGQSFNAHAATIVGAHTGEVVHMNGLTVNLHLMLETFYRPSRDRYRILVDGPTFPSDLYAVKSQIDRHGLDPGDALLILEPRSGQYAIEAEDIESLLDRHGQSIAVVVWNAVNFLTGQSHDVQRLIRAAHKHGCIVGLDLAHAAGNVPLALHDWNTDFAVWCTYKYLNCGPGAVAGCFVHSRHASRVDLPRLAGWWGNNPDTRFRMQLEPNYKPQEGAAGWQISNPPILALAPLRASLPIFTEAGLEFTYAKSKSLVRYLLFLLAADGRMDDRIATPKMDVGHGNQLSLVIDQDGASVVRRLREAGVVADYRQPNVIRVAPAPLYNTFHEVWRFNRVWKNILG